MVPMCERRVDEVLAIARMRGGLQLAARLGCITGALNFPSDISKISGMAPMMGKMIAAHYRWT